MIRDEDTADTARIDPRVVRTRQSIEDAFLKLMWRDGFEATTVRDITKEAGVNRATFYAHYEDKYALFNHVINKGLDEIIQTRLPEAATLSQDNLYHLVLALIEFFQRGGEDGCTTERDQPLRPMIESRVQERIAELLYKWLLATPNLALRTSPEITANLLSWSIFGLSLTQVKRNTSTIASAEIRTAVMVILNGIFIEELEESIGDSIR